VTYKCGADTVIWQVLAAENPPDDCRAIGVGKIALIMPAYCSIL